MDVTKFVALVFSQTLWFPKLQELWNIDPWEGFSRAKGLPLLHLPADGSRTASRLRFQVNLPANQLGPGWRRRGLVIGHCGDAQPPPRWTRETKRYGVTEELSLHDDLRTPFHQPTLWRFHGFKETKAPGGLVAETHRRAGTFRLGDVWRI